MAILQVRYKKDQVYSYHGRERGSYSKRGSLVDRRTITLTLEQRNQYRAETASMKTLDLCFPPMEPQVNNMHSKLMLFYHPGYLRIAVPTANLTRTDWGEDGLMENASTPSPRSLSGFTY